MPRRVIVEPEACFFCIAKHCDAPIDHRHARFYVAALHAVMHGSKANEQVCVKHAEILDEAMAFYVGNGVAFPERTPRFKPASTRVDVEPVSRPQMVVSAPGSAPRRRR